MLLRLGGALGRAEFFFQQIALLEGRYRVIAPDYPAAPSLDAMIDGLLAILDQEGVTTAHVIGGSFGGMLAQMLVRRAPRRVASLILSHTGAPDGRSRPAASIVAALPVSLLRWLIRRRLGSTLRAADPFWRRYFDDIVATMSKAEIVSRIRVQEEFGHQRFASSDLARWSGPVLLVEGDDDPLFPAAARARLRALYPQATVYEFHGTGHAAAVRRPAEYTDVVTRFIEQVESTR